MHLSTGLNHMASFNAFEYWVESHASFNAFEYWAESHGQF